METLKLKTEGKKYAVSDCFGEYVFFTNDYREAIEVAGIMDDMDDTEGSAAVMQRIGSTDQYELCY